MRWRIVAIAAAVAGVVLLVVVLVRPDERGPLERAQSIVGDRDNFDTGAETSDALARATDQLVQAGDRCLDDHGEVPSCLALREASAWTQTAAIEAVTCRAPGRFEIQRDAVAYLKRLAALPAAAPERPQPPAVPKCG